MTNFGWSYPVGCDGVPDEEYDGDDVAFIDPEDVAHEPGGDGLEPHRSCPGCPGCM